MPALGHSDGGEYVPGQTLRDGERVVLAHAANQDTTPRGAVSLELAITDRQVGVAAGVVPEMDTCRRTRRPHTFGAGVAPVGGAHQRVGQVRRQGVLAPRST
jgi:hypothetical protein